MIDFVKAAEEAHRIFVFEGWEWWNGEGTDKVPAVWQLELELRRLADHVRRESRFRVPTGRLYAEWDRETDTVEVGIQTSLGIG